MLTGERLAQNICVTGRGSKNTTKLIHRLSVFRKEPSMTCSDSNVCGDLCDNRSVGVQAVRVAHRLGDTDIVALAPGRSPRIADFDGIAVVANSNDGMVDLADATLRQNSRSV